LNFGLSTDFSVQLWLSESLSQTVKSPIASIALGRNWHDSQWTMDT